MHFRSKIALVVNPLHTHLVLSEGQGAESDAFSVIDTHSVAPRHKEAVEYLRNGAITL